MRDRQPGAPEIRETSHEICHQLVVTESQVGQRLDRFVAHSCPELSRAYVQKLIESGAVAVDGKAAKPSARLALGARVSVSIPPARLSSLAAEEIPLAIVYEDADLLVVDKPPGLVVHPAPGHRGGTLVNALLARYPDLRISNTLRPGIVHRLDKDTSGLMVVAKNDRALAILVDQMKKGQVLKEYLTLVVGRPKVMRGTIDAPIGRDPRRRKMMAVIPGGKSARTHFEVLEVLGSYSLLRVRLETGRTHQIRVHLASIGHPVVGDPVYGHRKVDLPISRQFLHAHRLSFKLPATGKVVEYASSLPADLQRVLNYLRGSDGAVDAAVEGANANPKQHHGGDHGQDHDA